MVTRLGTVLGTTLGTDVGSFTDGPPVFDATKVYGLSSLASTNYFATQTSGGEVGVTGGFGEMTCLVLSNLPSGDQTIIDSAGPGNTGFALQVRATGELRIVTFNGAGTLTIPTGFIIPASLLGKLITATLQVSGTGLQLRVSTLQGATTAMTGYTPRAAGGAQAVGRSVTSGQGFTAGVVVATAAFQGTPSTAQVQSVEMAVRSAGDLPSKAAIEALMPGTTVTHRWSLRDTLAAGGVPIADGSAAPASIADSVAGASADTMVKTGSPTVKVIDPTASKAWSYETSPIYQGADTLTSANYFVSTFDDATTAGQSFYNAFLVWIPSSVTQASSVVAGASSAGSVNTGWDLRFAANNATASWFMGDGSTFGSSGNAVLAAGKVNLLVCVWDQTNARQRLFANRAEVGAGVTRTGYAPTGAGTKINLGRSPRDVASATGTRTLLGYAQGLGAPTLAQVQALFDAVQSAEGMQGVSGMTSTLVDLTADIVAGGGAIPASLTNRAGAGTFTRTGSPTLSQIYARAMSW